MAGKYVSRADGPAPHPLVEPPCLPAHRPAASTEVCGAGRSRLARTFGRALYRLCRAVWNEGAPTEGLRTEWRVGTVASPIGLDITKAIAESMYGESKEPLFSPPPLLLRMVGAGMLGKKTGRGFHDYSVNSY